MRKKSFTIVEILVVVVMMGLIMTIARNFLNTDKQQKLIYGETCVNYVFGEMQKFTNDVKFGKSNVSELNGSKIVKTTTAISGAVFVSHTGSQNIKALYIANIYDTSGNNQPKYINFGPSYRSTFGQPPLQCASTRFTMAVQGSFGGDVCKVTTSKGIVINENCSPDSGASNVTGESILNVCDIQSVGTTNIGTANKCFEVAKIIVDKRQDDYFYIKCIKTDPISGLCTQRPLLR